MTGAALIACFEQALAEGWGYILGSSGQVCTQARREQWAALSPDNAANTLDIGSKWDGKRVADCSGLFRWAFSTAGHSIAHGSNSIWRNHTKRKGRLEEMSPAPGMAVFKLRGQDDYYHMGLVTHNGIIEAKSTQAGVVRSNLSGWTHVASLQEVDEMEEMQGKQARVWTADPNSTVNLRKGPGLSQPILARVPSGAVVRVLDNSEAWWIVQYAGMEGFMSADYLRQVTPDGCRALVEQARDLLDQVLMALGEDEHA